METREFRVEGIRDPQYATHIPTAKGYLQLVIHDACSLNAIVSIIDNKVHWLSDSGPKDKWRNKFDTAILAVWK